MTFSLFFSGCVTIKNQGELSPVQFSSEELSQRIHMRVQVAAPVLSDFFIYSWMNKDDSRNDALNETERIRYILKKCDLFDEVITDGRYCKDADIIITALPRSPKKSASYQTPYDLVFLGVIPNHLEFNRGVYFRIEKGWRGNFGFAWNTEGYMGVWAPFISIASKDWSLALTMRSSKSSSYWNDLRSTLFDYFSNLPVYQEKIRNTPVPANPHAP